MATKELAFNSKIKILSEYLRQITSVTQPAPPGTDVANTIKYFITTLLNILKDAPNMEGERFYGAKYAQSNMRLALFPTLNYMALYDVLKSLLPVIHLITIGQKAIMESILQLTACITPFLLWDDLTELPYSVALLIPMTQGEHYDEIVRILCVNLLPNTLGRDIENNMMTTESIAAIIMIVLQHCENASLHSMLIECLLPLRENLYKDMFTVISYGPPNTKIPAVKLLFHYYPQLLALTATNIASTYTESYTVTPWSVPICQRLHCINKIARPSASKMCTHPNMCAAECQLPPPAYICVDCYDTHGMRMYDDSFIDVVLPSDHITVKCANKACPLPGSKATAVCASLNCAKMNRNRPVSLCEVCHHKQHPGLCGHVQESIGNLWALDPETQSYVVDAIVSLLREAEPEIHTATEVALEPILDGSLVDFLVPRNAVNSRYGILILKELCTPRPALSVNALGRLLGMLFHWFQCTGSTHNPVATEILEKLKTESMTEWLQEVKKSHYEVILSTLLPHPPDFAKVGGQWERLSSRTDQLKEGLEKLIMLGPYDIVTYEVWDYIMPYWLESIRTELTLKEREEIKILLRQTFDIEMSPLPFLLDKMYHFIYERFESADQHIQEQGLQWLQILTSVDIAIPFLLLLNMFREGTTCLLKSTEATVSVGSRPHLEVKLNCFILMLDILLKQSELCKVTPHAGVTQNKSKEMFILLNDMINCIRPLKHRAKCETGTEDCDICQRLTVFYQLTFNLLRVICPRLESSLPVLDVKHLVTQQSTTHSTADLERGDEGTVPIPVIHTVFVTLLQTLETATDKDIHYYISSSLKSLFVHGQCLNHVYKTHPLLVNNFLQQQFVPRLWQMIDSRTSRTSKIAVVMLFHAIALGDGHRYFWSIVNGDCMHKNWQVRYAAVHKIRMIWENSSANFLSKNQILLTSLAHVFCQYVTLLHDSDHNVAQRALLQLHLIGQVALQAVIKCMAVQFDVVANDRQLILYKMTQLQNCLPQRQVFSFSFFLARLQQLFVEAELSAAESPESTNRGSLVKVGTDQNIDQMKKIAMFAAIKCDSVTSIRDASGVYEKSTVSMSSQFSNIVSKEKRSSLAPQFLKHKTKKKATAYSDSSIQDWLMLAQESLQDLSSLHNVLARSRKDDVMPEIGSDNAKIIKTLWKAMETEKLDHSVLHLLVSVIMKYMCSPSSNELPADDSQITKQRSTIDHILYLMGYADGKFYVQPAQVRASPVCEALILNLSKILDSNVEMGTKLLPDCLNVLRFCGSPQKYASDSQAADYTLVHLPPALTKYWVQTLLVVLYKYNYCNNAELSRSVNYLVRIVLNTLSAIPHSCESKERDSESVQEVQGLIQGTGDADSTTSRQPYNDGISTPAAGSATDCAAGSASHSVSENLKHQSGRTGVAAVNQHYTLLPMSNVVIHEEDEGQTGGTSRRSTLERCEVVHPPTTPSPAPHTPSPAALSTQSTPANALDRSDFLDQLMNPQSTPRQADQVIRTQPVIKEQVVIREQPVIMEQTVKEPSVKDQMDFAQLLSDPQQKSAGAAAKSSPILKKAYTQDSTKNKKSKKLRRQVGVDVASPAKTNPNNERKLKQWNTVDSMKSDEFMAELQYPQASLSAADSPAADLFTDTKESSSVSARGSNSSWQRERSSDNSVDRKPEASNKRFSMLMLASNRRQASKSNVWQGAASNSGVDEQTAIIQSAAAATDFMARSKRGQPLNIGKQESSDSAEHKFGVGTGTAHLKGTSGAEQSSTCTDCGKPIEDYTEEITVLCMIAAETYLNHNLDEAACMVYEMILSVSKIANTLIYSWQSSERSVFVPGNVISSALQFLRCTLHHLNPYKIMSALLLSSDDSDMFKTIVTALTDFPELSSQQALLSALEGINEKNEMRKVIQLIANLNSYISAMASDHVTLSQDWPKIVDQLEIFFRRLTSQLPEHQIDLTVLLNLLTSILRLPVITSHKGDRLVDTFSKLIASALQTHTFNMIVLAKLCQLCYRTFSKDRDKTVLARMIVNELMQVLKYKSTLPEANVLTLLEIVCMDCSSTLLPTYITNEIPSQLTCDMIIETGIMDVMRLYLTDAVEFVSDLHTLLKLKAHMKSSCLHEDTFGGLLKTGVAQIIALEMSAMIQHDVKAAQRVIPWLYNQPNTIQRGPKEFLESVDHVRFLCWLYIGALTHHAVAENVLHTKCQPLPFEDVTNISVMVMSIMTGFVEYSASSVEYMSSLFYGFILCQVWTVYCETLTADNTDREPDNHMDISQMIYDFWAKVTPTILNLMSHSRVLTEMVNLHVLSMMETLQECQSSVVLKLFPLWRLLLYSNQNKLPTNIHVRLQSLENWQPQNKGKYNKAILFDWVKKVQFKLAQIEVQSSTAVKFLAI